MPPLRRLTTSKKSVVIALLLATACGTSSSVVGPLELTPPDGWLVTDRQPGTIKVTNGTVGDGTDSRRGNATAVFDVYVDSAQSLVEFREVLDENNVRSSEERIEIDGYEAVVVVSEPSAFAPASETAFIPEWDVRIVFRAARADRESDLERNRPAFRRALASIRFRGRPPVRALAAPA